MYMSKFPMSTCNLRMSCLRKIHHANDCVQFSTLQRTTILTVMCTLYGFLRNKVRLFHTSPVCTRLHSCFKKTTRTPRVHLVNSAFAN